MKSMFLLVSLLLLGLLPSTVHTIGEVLRFSSTPSTNNYVILHNPDFHSMETSFTVCSWIRPRNNGGSNIVWFSYEVTSHGNEISFSADSVWNKLFDDNLASSATILDNDVWSHYCLSWDLASTKRRHYVNGVEVASKTTAAGRKLKTGGVLVLGQDQDSPGGSFNAGQAFSGDLYNLVVLDKALSGGEVSDLYKRGRCGDLDVNLNENVVLGWTDFLDAQRNGDVVVERGTCSQWELVRGLIDDQLLEHLMQMELHNYNM